MFPYRDRQTATTTFFCSCIRIGCPLNGMPCTGAKPLTPWKATRSPRSVYRAPGANPQGLNEWLLDHVVHGHMVAGVAGVVLWITRPAQEVIHGHLVAEATVIWSRRPTGFCGCGHGHFVAQT